MGDEWKYEPKSGPPKTAQVPRFQVRIWGIGDLSLIYDRVVECGDVDTALGKAATDLTNDYPTMGKKPHHASVTSLEPGDHESDLFAFSIDARWGTPRPKKIGTGKLSG